MTHTITLDVTPALVKSLLVAFSGEGENEFFSDAQYYLREKGEVVGLGKVEVVEDFGGEGQGDLRYVVFKVTFADETVKYYRQEGYYSSCDGTDWDGDFTEVTPKEVLRTEWVRA